MTCQLLVRRRERDARKRAIPSQFFKVLFSSARRREKRDGRLFVYTCRERAAKRRPRRGRTWGYTSSVRHPSPACPVHTMRRASPPWPAAEGEEVSVGTGVAGSRRDAALARMASFRGDEAWTARRRAGAGYARRHAPECDAPRLEVARSVHLSTWPPCIVPPCAARSEIEVAATEVVLNAGAEILVRKDRKRARNDEFSEEPRSKGYAKKIRVGRVPGSRLVAFLFSHGRGRGKTSQLVADGVCAKFAVGA